MDPSRFSGRIKSFNTEKGFGFIDCPQTHERWKRDVFLHRKWMGDLQEGEDITFIVDTNDDGMPQAREILRMDGRMPGPGPDGKMPGEGRGPGGKRRREKGDGKKGDGKGKKGDGKGKNGGGKGKSGGKVDGKGKNGEKGAEN